MSEFCGRRGLAMNPLFPTVGPRVTRRNALKRLGAGVAFLWLGWMGGNHAEVATDMRRQRGARPLTAPVLPHDALEPLFMSRSTTRLPLSS